MSYDRLKKFSSGEKAEHNKPASPYADFLKKKSEKESKATEPGTEPAGDVFKEKSYFISQTVQLKQEIKDLKQDIATLYAMVAGIDISDMTPEGARDLYFKFKADSKHLIRIKK